MAAPSSPGQANLCSLTTSEQWRTFLEFYAGENGWADTCEDSTCNARYYGFVTDRVYGTFSRCADYLAAHPGIARCTDRMRRFTTAWMAQHNADSNGFLVDNRTYLAAEEAPDKPPGMMNPPQSIIDALPDRQAVQEAARRGGWKYLTHDSAIEGVRTFILVPDQAGRFDLWILLNLPKNAAMIDGKMPLSVLAVQKKTVDGKPLEKVRLFFRDYGIASDDTGHYTIAPNADANGKCYSCHPNGVRQLIARRTKVLEAAPVSGEAGYDALETAQSSTEFAYRRLLEFNRKLRSYGQPDWTGQIRPEDHGPALGGEFACTDCHDGKTRAVLNASTSMNQIRQKMVAELTMPPDSDLPRLLEREQWHELVHGSQTRRHLVEGVLAQRSLADKFADSRFTALKEWFLQVPCR